MIESDNNAFIIQLEEVSYGVRLNRLEKSINVENMFVCLICNSIGIVLAYEDNNLFLRGTLSSHIDSRAWFWIGIEEGKRDY